MRERGWKEKRVRAVYSVQRESGNKDFAGLCKYTQFFAVCFQGNCSTQACLPTCSPSEMLSLTDESQFTGKFDHICSLPAALLYSRHCPSPLTVNYANIAALGYAVVHNLSAECAKKVFENLSVSHSLAHIPHILAMQQYDCRGVKSSLKQETRMTGSIAGGKKTQDMTPILSEFTAINTDGWLT